MAQSKPGMDILHDKDELYAYFKQNIYLHLYSIGDLDDYFWPHTVWYGWREAGVLTAVALLYTGLTPPPLLALTTDLAPMVRLLANLVPLMPTVFQAHLSPNLERCFGPQYRFKSYGPHLKMGLIDWQPSAAIETTNTCLLTAADAAEVNQFYQASYPDSAYVAHMLDMGFYFGLRINGQLASVAGVHVYSAAYRVASLGNIATHPHHRGQGYAQATIARLCQELHPSVDHIGLNVMAENETAVALYKKLGFQESGRYGEFELVRKRIG